MANYSIFGNSAANTTAANAELFALYNPTATTTCAARMYEFEVGPQANSADNTYGMRVSRITTAPTVTAITPSPIDYHSGAANMLAGNTSTVHGTAGVELLRIGFHMRGGYRWVSIPGGELIVTPVFNNGIILEYIFAQGTDVLGGSMFFAE